MFVFNQDSDTYVYIYIAIYKYVYVKLYAHTQLFITRKNEKLRGPVLCNVGGVKFRPIVTT